MSPLIFASCRDCPSYLASAETVRDLLLPAETTVQEKWLPAETVRVILLPAEALGRKLNHTDSLCRKLSTKDNSLYTLWKHYLDIITIKGLTSQYIMTL